MLASMRANEVAMDAVRRLLTTRAVPRFAVSLMAWTMSWSSSATLSGMTAPRIIAFITSRSKKEGVVSYFSVAGTAFYLCQAWLGAGLWLFSRTVNGEPSARGSRLKEEKQRKEAQIVIYLG